MEDNTIRKNKISVILWSVSILLTFFFITYFYTRQEATKQGACYGPDENTRLAFNKLMGLGPTIIDTLIDENLGDEGNKIRDNFGKIRGQLLRKVAPIFAIKVTTKVHTALTPESEALIKEYYDLGSTLVALPDPHKIHKNKGIKPERKTISLDEIEKQWNLYSKEIVFTSECPSMSVK